jgi:hypothetical protein
MVFMGLVLITVGVAYTISRQGKPLSTEKLPNGILEIEVPFPQIATIAAAIKFTLVFGAVG